MHFWTALAGDGDEPVGLGWVELRRRSSVCRHGSTTSRWRRAGGERAWGARSWRRCTTRPAGSGATTDGAQRLRPQHRCHPALRLPRLRGHRATDEAGPLRTCPRCSAEAVDGQLAQVDDVALGGRTSAKLTSSTETVRADTRDQHPAPVDGATGEPADQHPGGLVADPGREPRPVLERDRAALAVVGPDVADAPLAEVPVALDEGVAPRFTESKRTTFWSMSDTDRRRPSGRRCPGSGCSRAPPPPGPRSREGANTGERSTIRNGSRISGKTVTWSASVSSCCRVTGSVLPRPRPRVTGPASGQQGRPARSIVLRIGASMRRGTPRCNDFARRAVS